MSDNNNLSKPVVTASYHDRKLEVSWTTVAGAYAYVLLIDDAAGAQVFQKEILAANYTPPVDVTALGFTPSEGSTYTIRVFAKSPSSDPVTVEILAPLDILRALQSRLENNKVGGDTVVFDATTLPNDERGDEGAVLQLIQAQLKTEALSVKLDAPMVLSEQAGTLTVTGKATVLNAADSQVTTVFSVAGDLKLQLTLKALLPSGWRFSVSFPALKGADFDYLSLADNAFYLTTQPHTEPGVFFPLPAGLSYQGTLTVSSTLVPVTNGADNLQHLKVGGGVDNAQTTPAFSLAGDATLQDLTLNLLGQPALTLKRGAVSLVTTRNPPDKPNTSAALIQGAVPLGGRDFQFQLDAPTQIEKQLQLRIAQAPPSFADASTLITLAVGSDLLTWLPDSLKNLLAIQVNGWDVLFDPGQRGPTVITLTLGTDSTWNILAPYLSISGFQWVLQTTRRDYVPGQRQTLYFNKITGTLTLGESFPVNVELSIPAGGVWVLNLSPKSAPITLAALGSYLGKTASSLIGALPQPIQEMGNLSIDTVRIGFTPQPAALAFVSFHVQQVAPWVIVTDVLAFTRWDIQLTLNDPLGNLESSGLLTGQIQLGKAESGLTLGVTLPIPIGEQGWTVSMAQRPLPIPGLDSLFNLIGASALNPYLPNGVKDLGQMTLTQLDVVFNTTLASPIRSVYLSIETRSRWNIIASEGLAIDDLSIRLALINADSPYLIGQLEGVLTLATVPLYLTAQKASKTDPWLFELSTVRLVHLPSLSQLATWMAPQSMVQYVPTDFMPFPDGLDITNLNLKYNITQNTLDLLAFTLQNSGPWQIIPGYLTVDDTQLMATLTNLFSAQRDVSVHAEALLILAGIHLRIQGDRRTLQEPWVLAAQLAEPVSLNFESLFTQLLPSGINVPYDHGFPREITLNTLETRITPSTQEFFFGLSSSFDWSFDFGVTTLRIKAISGDLTVDKLNEQNVRPYRFRIGGSFAFAGIDTTLRFQTGNTDTQTLLTAQLTPENAASLAPSTLADSLTTAGNAGTRWESLPLPTDLAPLKYASAQLLINLSQNVFLLYGSSQGFGQIGFLTQKQSDGSWGYFIAAGLDDSFTFASITPALGIIDGVLKIKDAGFGISSFSANSVQTLTQGIPEFSAIVKIRSDNAGAALSPGANIWGTLLFTTPLFGNVPKVLSGVDTGPSITLYAFIARTPGESVFRATFGNFNLLQTVLFKSVALEYRPRNSNVVGDEDKLSLVGDVSISIGQATLSFHSALVITNTRGRFFLETTQELTDPLGMFNIRLQQMKLLLEYTFGGQSTQFNIALNGQVAFGAKKQDGTYPVTLEGNVLFVSGAPQIVEIALASPLKVDDFLTTVLPSNLWPSGWLDITFETGRIYYAAVAGTFFGKEYKEGYNLDTRINVYGFPFLIAAQVARDGLTVTGKTDHSIDLLVAQLTDKEFHLNSSPELFITTVGQNKRFGFDLGLVLFKKNVGTAALSWSITNSQFEGSVTFTILDNNATLSFAWNKEKGFRILDWPLSYLSTAYDYATRLSDLSSQFSSGSGCAQLVNLAFKKTISTAYSVNVDKGYTPPQPIPPGSYLLPLKITCTAKAADQDILSTSITVPLVLQAPAQLSFDQFAQALGSSIVSSADALVQELLTNPGKFAAFIGVVGLEKLAPAALSSLMCRQVNSPEVKAQSTSEVDTSVSEADAAAEGAADAAAAAEGAADAAAAAAAAEGTFDAVGVIGGILGVLAGLVAGLLSLFGVSKTPEQQRAEQAKRDAERARDQAIRAVEAKLALSGLGLSYIDENKLRVSWNQVAGSGVKYTVRLFKGSDKIYESDSNHVQVDITDARITPGATYKAQVSAWLAAKSQTYRGAWQEQSLTLPAVSTPVNVMLEQVETTLHLTWQPGSPQTQTYELGVLDAQGQPLTPQPSVTVTGTDAVIQGPPLAVGNSYKVRIRAVLPGHLKSDWVQSGAVYYSALPAPTGLALSYHTEKTGAFLQAAWTGPAQATSYGIEVFRADGTPPSPTPTITATFSAARIEGAGLTPGQTFQVRVASKDQRSTVWSAKVSIGLIALGPVTNMSFQFQDNGLIVRWDPVTGATAYNFKLLDSGGTQVWAPSQPLTAPTVTVRDPSITFRFGQVYQGRAQPLAGSSSGYWSDPTRFTIPPLNARELAQELKARGDTVLTAAPKIKTAYPATTAADMARILFDVFQPPVLQPLDLAKALKAAPYSMLETSPALKSVYPQLTATQLADILIAVYQDQPTDARQLAIILHTQGVTVLDAAPQIKQRFPATTAQDMARILFDVFQPPALQPLDLAKALKGAGYPMPETSVAIKSVLPNITATQLAQALVQAYNTP